MVEVVRQEVEAKAKQRGDDRRFATSAPLPRGFPVHLEQRAKWSVFARDGVVVVVVVVAKMGARGVCWRERGGCLVKVWRARGPCPNQVNHPTREN